MCFQWAKELERQKRDEEAVQYLQRAVELGSEEAMIPLGNAKENGTGCAPDLDAAIELYIDSATRFENPIARDHLASLYSSAF